MNLTKLQPCVVLAALIAGPICAQTIKSPVMCTDAVITGKVASSVATHPFNKSKIKVLFLELPSPVDVAQGPDQQCGAVLKVSEIQLIDGEVFSSRLGQMVTLTGRLLPQSNAYDIKPVILVSPKEVKAK